MTELIYMMVLCAGLSFWIEMIRRDPPNSWHTKPREDGWARCLFLYLPLCLMAGPLLWGLLIYLRVRK